MDFEKVVIGSDIKRAEARANVLDYLVQARVLVDDFGGNPDYADIAQQVAEAVANGDYSTGILICRNGIGMSIAANKIVGVRAVRCVSEQDAYDARTVNDANVLTMGDINPDLARRIVNSWLTTSFSGEDRYIRGLEIIADIEAGKRLVLG